VSYRLDGFDKETVTVSRSELGPVTYTNLSGGSYHFVMELKDALGRGSKILSVPIVKERALHEQAWFYILIVLAVLALLAALVRIYVRRKMHVLEAKHREAAERERINNELSLAAQIQADMLPSDYPAFPDRSEFDIYASMQPAREVGGDFYDFFLIDDDHLCLVLADVSGKGVPAALFMMASKIILANNAMMGKSPGQILTDTNASICSHNRQEMFVTVWLGILELSTGKLTAANAGHEYPVLKQPGEAFEFLKDKHGFVIGGMEGMKYTEYEVTLRPGTKLFLYTDGIPEATDTANRAFGAERMLNALNRSADAVPEQILKNVHTAVDLFVDKAEQFDDLTMLCLEYRWPEKEDGPAVQA
jgi:serine phosphatase RsbU (regulator of sigma subunit)